MKETTLRNDDSTTITPPPAEMLPELTRQARIVERAYVIGQIRRSVNYAHVPGWAKLQAEDEEGE